ncbi:type II toxin-antitoxin system HicB family antitoxin [Candidatus Pacearchaeota archaeon]|nr:type II toxin-antitoxin system HicB family antitoxin [Candidatus Pacearchaeota archaeon]
MEKKIELDIVIYPEGKGKDKVYSISSVQVPNVVTQGDTIEEAISRLREALELYFESVPYEKDNLIKITEDEQEGCNNPMISRIFL